MRGPAFHKRRLEEEEDDLEFGTEDQSFLPAGV